MSTPEHASSAEQSAVPELLPFAPRWHAGFRALVVGTHREFGFEFDPILDADLDSPGKIYDPLLVLVSGEEVIGSVALRDDESGAELKRMYLSPCYRGRGYGRQLLDAAVEAARQQGHRRICLDTAEHQKAAQKLYEAAGFRRVAESDGPGGSRTLYFELELVSRTD